ncbi:MAG TPA: hypothetical protein VKA38_14180, partial [Draconibacterium sp.]|nr:hypothetical protein [Draconibacterium sp.]
MNKLSSKQVVFFLSIILTIVVFLFLFFATTATSFLLYIAIALILFFLIAFFLVQFVLNRFITDKIKPIYKIINYIPQKGKQVKRESRQRFVELSEVEHDVEEWAQNQLH